jgi:PGDYG protein
MILTKCTVMSQACNHRFVTARKLPLPVRVDFAKSAGVLHTLEGEVPYVQGDALMTGLANDRWPVPRARFDTDYEALSPTSAGEAGKYVKRPKIVLARQLSEACSVLTPLGARLQGRAGDWLVQYGTDDHAIVAEVVFAQSYEILGVA